MGRAAPDAVAGPDGADGVDGPELRQRLQVQALLPQRLLRRLHQGPLRLHRRRQHRLLPVEQRAVPGAARRDRHRAAGDGAGGAVDAADQRVRARHRRRRHHREGDALPPLVRPHRRLPPLRHPLEPRPDRLPRRRRPRPPLPARRPRWPQLPRPPDVGLRLHLGRLRLGHRRRPLQVRLPLPALRLALQRPQDRRLRGRRAGELPPLAGVAVGLHRAQRAAERRHELGAAEVHGLLLLPGLLQESRQLPRVLAQCQWVRHACIFSFASPHVVVCTNTYLSYSSLYMDSTCKLHCICMIGLRCAAVSPKFHFNLQPCFKNPLQNFMIFVLLVDQVKVKLSFCSATRTLLITGISCHVHCHCKHGISSLS